MAAWAIPHAQQSGHSACRMGHSACIAARVPSGVDGRGRVESGSKSLKKFFLRDFSSFNPQQTFSPKKFLLFGFLVPKIPENYEKVPATKQGLISHALKR